MSDQATTTKPVATVPTLVPPVVKTTVAKPAAVKAVAKPAAVKAVAKPAAVKAVAKPAAVKAVAKPVAVKTAAVDAGGLINQNAVNKMQQDAAGIPPAAETKKEVPMEPIADVVEVEAAQSEKNVFGQSKFNQVFVNALFTLNLTDERMFDTKAALSAVKVDAETLNLYSPFRKAAKKKNEEASTDAPQEGVVRASLEGLLNITDEVNSSKIVFLGNSADAHSILSGAIANVRNSIEALFPVAPDYPLFEIQSVDDEEDEDPENADQSDKPVVTDTADQILFKDVLQVRTWINSPESGDAADDTHNAVVNFVVNAGALYDSIERIKYVKQVETVLNLITRGRPEGTTNLLLAVNLSSTALVDPSVREFISQLLDEEDYMLYTRAELHKCNISDWLPTTVEGVDNALLSKDGDLLFVKLLNNEVAETALV